VRATPNAENQAEKLAAPKDVHRLPTYVRLEKGLGERLADGQVLFRTLSAIGSSDIEVDGKES